MQGISLKPYIEKRAVEIGTYIVEKSATVRQAAKNFGVSKSTVHKDVAERLPQIDVELAKEAIDSGKAMKVLDMIQEAYVNGHIDYQIPGDSEVEV